MSDSSRRFAPLLAIAVYAAFAAWLIWPALANLGTAIPGDEGDAFVHLWTFDWVRDALLSGQSPYFTERIFYPAGAALYTHNIAWLNIGLWLPLQLFFSDGAAYTLAYLAVLVLNGAGTYFLVRRLTRFEAAAFLSGFIVTGWPYIITRYSQPNLIFVAFVPLALLAMHRLIESGEWRDVLWLGLAVAGIGFSRYQLLIMGAPMLALAALFWLWQAPAKGRGQTFLQLAAAAGLGALLLLPFAGPVINFQATRDFAEDIVREGQEWGEADLLGLLLPGEGVPLLGRRLMGRFPNMLTHTPIGTVTLALAILGLFGRRRDRWLWLSMALLLIILALGRQLTINGQELISLPYAWLEENLLIVRLIRFPSRFLALLAIPVAVLAGYGVEVLLRRLSPRGALAVVLILTALIAISYRRPAYRTLQLETPAWYETVAAEEGDFGLVTVPLTGSFDEYGMYYQLTHNKPLVGGHVSRPPREVYDFINETPFLDELREQDPVPPDSGDISGQLRPLAANNLPFLIIHKRFLEPDETSDWRRWMGIAPAHEDDDLLVYPTAVIAGEDYRVLGTAVPGLDFVSGVLYPDRIGIGDPLSGITHWSIDPELPRTWTACYLVSDADGNEVEETCQLISFPPSTGEDAQLAADAFVVPLSRISAAGTYQVSVMLASANGNSSGPMDLGPLYVNRGGPDFEPPQPETPLAVDLGPALALAGFDGPRVGGQTLDLTLFWHAKEETDISYRYYIHIFDAETGELAVQLDGVPRDWAYPTNSWDAGEYVSDPLSVPLGGVEPGTYVINVGFYHPDTGERLPATNADGSAITDNTIPLAEFDINTRE